MKVGMEWWTDPTWEQLHKLGLAFDKARDKKVRERFVAYVQALQKVLLCGKCQYHFGIYLRDEPVVHGKYFEWTWKLHNLVNSRNRQPTLSLEKARAEYARNGVAEQQRRELRRNIRKQSYRDIPVGVQTTQPTAPSTNKSPAISPWGVLIGGSVGILTVFLIIWLLFK